MDTNLSNHGSTFARDAMVDRWTQIDTDNGRKDANSKRDFNHG
jgi:hypothetical protein